MDEAGVEIDDLYNFSRCLKRRLQLPVNMHLPREGVRRVGDESRGGNRATAAEEVVG